jgi:pectin methylesterase-like acyl-CoA thioesterase
LHRLALFCALPLAAAGCAARTPAPPGTPAAAPAPRWSGPTLQVAAGGAFPTIQAAIDAAPATGARILIAPGTYREQLVVEKPGITLAGPDADASKAVIVFGASAGTTGGTLKSATLEVTAEDFRAQDLTIVNEWNRTHVQQFKGSQALALMVSGDRAVFRNVRFIGDQDTVYAGSSDCSPPGHGPAACTLTRQYFQRCFIEGNVDFIFGNSLAVFDRCEIHSNRHSIGYITAHGRQSEDEPGLFVFDHCRLTADAGVEHVWLGRPWRPMASVVFMSTEMGAHIEAPGFREWHPGETHYIESVFYAEYNSSGPGAHPGERDPHTRRLTPEEAARYQPSSVLRGSDGWNPAAAP